MDKHLSIVLVDKRPYRKIAQENWGLTREQMRGMHVHHRIPRSSGGTNDPSNLYVCSPSFHRWVWHDGEEFIEWAERGGSKGGKIGGKIGGRKNAESGHMQRIAHLGGKKGGHKGGTKTKQNKVGIFAPGVQSLAGKIGGPRGVETQRRLGIGLFGLGFEERSLNTKTQWEDPEYRNLMLSVSRANGVKVFQNKLGVFAEENLGKGAKTTNSQLWVDPEHPELGAHHFNVLKKLQRQNGYLDGKENRVKAFIEEG
jgi:hypothetical protein